MAFEILKEFVKNVVQLVDFTENMFNISLVYYFFVDVGSKARLHFLVFEFIF